MVSARGGKLLPVRTGYEQVIANRCSDKFAYDAKGDGTVLAVDDKFVTIEYKDEDGTTIKAGLKLGVAHGKASGAIIPHTMVTDLRAGTKFKKGDILVWNTGYFERDILNPNGVSMKGGTIARVALIETNDTLEDGCAISPKLSKALGTPISKAKTLLLTFDQSVTNMVSIGDKVDIDTILAIIEDGSLAGIAGNDKNLLGLTKLSGSSPKAKLKGVVSNIEVVWMGDKADMHPTLRNIANADARRRKETQERTGADIALHGEVTEPTFVFQQKLTANTMAITIFMDMELTADIGDKAVFDNVLKSIIGRVMEGTNTTEDGKPIDAVFSYRGIADRVVLSPEINGTTNSVMIAVSKKFAEIYNT